jgi:hypothetical protein
MGYTLRRTTNGGTTWVIDALAVGVTEILYDLYGHRFALGGGRLFRLDTELGVDPEESPHTYALEQNYPNPFNPSTTIEYGIQERGFVTLKVFDILGREVATLVNGVEEPGYKTVRWDAGNVASGVYFYRLQSGSFVGTKKLLLLR